MVYKRYVKKEGKTYGPYYQSSKKENGKVITSYVGKKSKPESKKSNSVYLILAVSFLALFAVFFLASQFNFTGKAISSTENSTSNDLYGQSDSVIEDSSGSVNQPNDAVNNEDSSEDVLVVYENISGNDGAEISSELNETNEIVSEELNETIPENNETVIDNNSLEEENVSEEIVVVENETEIVNESETSVEENGTTNETGFIDENSNDSEIIDSVLNDTEVLNKTEIINETVEENITIVSTNISLKINTTQYPVVVGMPVKWKKNIQTGNVTNLSVELPKEATNITVYKISNESIGGESVKKSIDSFSLTGNVISFDSNEGSVILDFFSNLFRNVFGAITGRAIDVSEDSDSINVDISENATEYEIEYETPAPVAFEETTSGGKLITISSEVHYENILAYAELPREISIDNIRLYHYDETTGEKVITEFDAYDYDGNLILGNTPEEKGFGNISVGDLINSTNENNTNPALVSFITWVVPHLSNQTYEIIIEISKAEHLDSQRNFIEDVYDFVNAQDDIWTEAIPEGDYIRVTFEENLTNKNDITVYARPSRDDSGEPRQVSVEVYEGECSGNISINDIEIPLEIYAKKKRIDELREVLNG